jgi:RNA polymerase sigma factor (sigma-70 family)
MPIAELRPARPRSLGDCLRDDDAALVWRMQAGDERAFAAIFKRHHAPLLSYCWHMLGNRDEGEDALQQAFIRAHQALLGGTVPRELRPWLYAIARNCCLSAIAARRPTSPLENHAAALAGLSDEVRWREDLRELLAGIGRLPEDQRSALLLAELDDLSHQAIATVLECPVSKVKALIYQARSALIADRDARETSCQDIREQLSVARGGELRRGPLRRHLNLCAGCRDFQLALGAQRQSLAAVLPVAPSAGLAAAILGHGTAHAAGAASIGGAGAGAAPACGATGTSVGAATTGATVSGGSGIAAGGTAATSTAVGVGAGGGTSVGALVGGGLITKIAVGGAVVALAAAGTVAVRQRPARATSSRVTRARPASFAARSGEVAAIAEASDGTDGALTPGSPAALAGATAGPAGSAGLDPLTALTSSAGTEELLALTGTSPPIPVLTSIPGQTSIPGWPTVKAGESSSGAERPAKAGRARKARAKLRRVALRRRALRLRKARRARLRKALRKALAHRRHMVAPKPPKPPKPPTPTVVPAPVSVRHRKARFTPAPLSAPAGTTAGSESKESGEKRQRRRSAAGTGATSTGSETSTTGTGKGKEKVGSGTGTEQVGSGTGTEKAGSTTGTGKAGLGAGAEGAGKSSSGADDKEAASGANTGNSDSEVGTGADSTGRGGGAAEPGGVATQTSETTGTGGADATSRKGTPHLRKHLVEAEQLPNL